MCYMQEPKDNPYRGHSGTWGGEWWGKARRLTGLSLAADFQVLKKCAVDTMCLWDKLHVSPNVVVC